MPDGRKYYAVESLEMTHIMMTIVVCDMRERYD